MLQLVACARLPCRASSLWLLLLLFLLLQLLLLLLLLLLLPVGTKAAGHAIGSSEALVLQHSKLSQPISSSQTNITSLLPHSS